MVPQSLELNPEPFSLAMPVQKVAVRFLCLRQICMESFVFGAQKSGLLHQAPLPVDFLEEFARDAHVIVDIEIGTAVSREHLHLGQLGVCQVAHPRGSSDGAKPGRMARQPSRFTPFLIPKGAHQAGFV